MMGWGAWPADVSGYGVDLGLPPANPQDITGSVEEGVMRLAALFTEVPFWAGIGHVTRAQTTQAASRPHDLQLSVGRGDFLRAGIGVMLGGAKGALLVVHNLGSRRKIHRGRLRLGRTI